MQQLYLYNSDTFEYAGSTIRQKDPMASAQEKKIVYFNVPNSTTVAPPTAQFPNRALVFNVDENKWNYVSDYRNLRVINVETKEIVAYDRLGDVEYPFVIDIPNRNHLKYLDYIDEHWVLTKRDDILADIWSFRKSIRDMACEKDLEYNGHFYHVDKKSYNDILLAAQDVLLTGDQTITKRWVTADSDSVTLSGADLIAILKAYGARRQALVYESNDQWKIDAQLSDDELLDLYDELSVLAYEGE